MTAFFIQIFEYSMASPIITRFSAAAPAYSLHAGVQQKAAALLADSLAAVVPAATTGWAVDVGAGVGLSTTMFALRWPTLHWLALDRAEATLHHNPRPAVVADAAALPIAKVELLTANCVLQWLDNPLDVFQGWRSHSRVVAATLFLEGTCAEWYQALAKAGLPPPHRFLPRDQVEAFCHKNTITLCTASFPMPYPSASAFVRAVHRLGAGSPAVADYPRLTPRQMRAALHHLEAAGHTTYSYEVACLLAV
jgi:hypothetical protein